MEEITNSFKEFFKLYFENSKNDNLYSWLSPAGEFYPVNTNHGKWAEEYLQTINPSKVLDYMFRRGWFRITRYGTRVYCHNPVIKPSGKALKALIDECIETNMMNIHWDNEDDDIILWSNDDY